MKRFMISGILSLLLEASMVSPVLGACDLIVTDIWADENGQTNYQVMNIGDEASPDSWNIVLWIDGQKKETIIPGIKINSKSRFDGVMKTTLPSQYNTVYELIIGVDQDKVVDENNETNNLLTRRWNLPEPPDFMMGPYVTFADTTNAMIEFMVTPGFANARIYIGRDSISLEKVYESLQPDMMFYVNLQGLEPGTIYHYKVELFNEYEQSTTSKVRLFTTKESEDSVEPQVELKKFVKPVGQPLMILQPDVSDDKGVDYVAFYLGKKLLGIDYSSPFQWELRRLDLGQILTDIQVEARAFDRAGNMATVSTVFDFFHNPNGPEILLNPELPTSTDETLDVNATITETDDGIDTVRFYIDGVKVEEQNYHLYIPRDGIDYYPPSITFEYSVSPSFVGDGDHTLTIVAIDSESEMNQIQRTINFQRPVLERPDFEVTSHVYGYGTAENYIEIVVNARNISTMDARSFRLDNYTLRNYQIYETSATISPARPEFAPTFKIEHVEGGSKLTMDSGTIVLPPGTGISIRMKAVPLLTDGSMTDAGFDGAEIYFAGDWQQGSTSGIGYWTSPVIEPNGSGVGMTMEELHRFLTLRSDYILLTSPEALFNWYGGGYDWADDAPESALRNDVHDFLVDIARLAIVRNGVMAFVDAYTERTEISHLLGSGDAWSSRMAKGYSDNGYLLLIGEAQILPADSLVVTATFCPMQRIYPSDVRYANTKGDSWEPELNVGRIIGNSISELRTSIQTSLNVARGEPGWDFGRFKSVIYAGDGDGAENFRECARNLLYQAGLIFAPTVYEEVYGTSLETLFQSDIADADYIVYRGHGNPEGWADVTSTGYINSAVLGAGHPLVAGWTCLSGEYERWDDYFFIGLGEAFMRSGAGCFIGAVEESPRSENSDAARWFQSYWLDNNQDAGTALRNVKRRFVTDSVFDWANYQTRRWTAEYNLYGDPKYGVDSIVSALTSRKFMLENDQLPELVPGELFEIKIPEYIVTDNNDGTVSFQIPGQRTLGVPGNPVVPEYEQRVKIPEGFRVTRFSLVQKETETTINAEVVKYIDAVDSSYDYIPVDENDFRQEDYQYWPPVDYEWKVEHKDQHDELVLKVYPLKVLPSRGIVSFFDDFKFDFSVMDVSMITVDVLDQMEQLDPNTSFSTRIRAENSGEPVDLYLVTEIFQAGYEDPVVGVPSRILHGLTGIANIDVNIDTTSLPSGLYDIRVSLNDNQGELCSDTASFVIKGAALYVDELQAVPVTESGNTMIKFSMNIYNKGSIKTDGTAIMVLRDGTGTVIQKYSQLISDLGAGAKVEVAHDCTIDGKVNDTLTLTGFAQAQEGISNVKTTMVIVPGQ